MLSAVLNGITQGVDVSKRLDFDEYGVALARAVSLRADCSRRRVGAVIIDTRRRVIATGYNGAPSGQPGCLTAGACPRGRQRPEDVTPGSSYDTGAGACIAIHAEANAIMYSDPLARAGATLYVTDAPCDGCARLIVGSGISRVVWPKRHADEWVLNIAAPGDVSGNYPIPVTS